MTEIIEQAEKLGYGIEHLINNNEYINLCLIQKWLRDEKGLDLTIQNAFNVEYYYCINDEVIEHFDTYEQTLEQGIKEALKQIEG